MELEEVASHLFGHPAFQQSNELRHIHYLFLLYLHMTLLQLIKQVHTVHGEYQKRVVIYLAAHHIDDRCQMLAGHRPVGA